MSRQRYAGSCAQATERFDLSGICCGSCHEDADGDGDYPLAEIEVGDEWWEVCCTVQSEYNEVIR